MPFVVTSNTSYLCINNKNAAIYFYDARFNNDIDPYVPSDICKFSERIHSLFYYIENNENIYEKCFLLTEKIIRSNSV